MSYIQFSETLSTQHNNDLTCRICLENDNLNNLIYPCRCSGNSKYVHSHCLNEWRIININNDKYHRCEICNYRFVISNNICRLITSRCEEISSNNNIGFFLLLFMR